MNPNSPPAIVSWEKDPSTSARQGPQAPGYHEQKHLFDRVLAGCLLIVFSPMIGILIGLVRLTSRGPAIYRQVRVGKDGRCFVILKLRSMISNAETDGPVWSCGGADPRVTRLGRFLRTSHLDELPQLWNVCRGEMAIVGPRPERPELVDSLEERVPGYIDRLAVRPGISGLAQINLPPDSCIESVKRKLKLDLEYIRTAGLRMDLSILAWTAARLCGMGSMWTAKRLGLTRSLPLPNQPEPDGAVLFEDILSR